MQTQKYKFIRKTRLESLKEILDKSIDVIVTSPPYNIGLKYNKYKKFKTKTQYLE